MEDIRRRARILGIETKRLRKADIIRAIQIKEGHSPCFGTVNGKCDEFSCCFREDCIGITGTC